MFPEKIQKNNNPALLSHSNKLVESVNISDEDLLRQELHFKQVPLGIIEWDTEFRVIRWNPAAARIFGYSQPEAMGKSAFELIVPEASNELVAEIRATVQSVSARQTAFSVIVVYVVGVHLIILRNLDPRCRLPE